MKNVCGISNLKPDEVSWHKFTPERFYKKLYVEVCTICNWQRHNPTTIHLILNIITCTNYLWNQRSIVCSVAVLRLNALLIFRAFSAVFHPGQNSLQKIARACLLPILFWTALNISVQWRTAKIMIVEAL